MTKFLDPTNDYAFKKVFGTEKNKPVLIQFLNDVLRASIQEVTFLPTVQDPEAAAKKQSIVDVLCKDQSGHQYIVEMQVAHTEAFVERAQFYACRAYASQIGRGEGYQFLRPVVFLAITDFVMFPEKEGYQSDHVILDKEHYTQDLKGLSFTFLELPKFNKSFDELTTNTDRWMYFFKHADRAKPEEFEALSRESGMIHQAFRALDQFYWTEAEVAAYERELKSLRDAAALLAGAKNLGREEGREEGLREGLREGEKKAIRSLVQRMASMQMDVLTISRAANLPPEEVEMYLDGARVES